MKNKYVSRKVQHALALAEDRAAMQVLYTVERVEHYRMLRAKFGIRSKDLPPGTQLPLF